MMKIKKVTFYDTVHINDKLENKSAVDRLNEYIVEKQISKCDVINVETRCDSGHSSCLNLFYWESE